MTADRLDYCLGVFARGVAATRSIVRPYLASRVRKTWWLRDERPPVARGRNDEWIASTAVDPLFLDRSARARASHGFLLNIVSPGPDLDLQSAKPYRGLGYRLWRTEKLMMRSTGEAPTTDPSILTQAVDSPGLAALLAQTAGGRLVPSHSLASPSASMRCHVVIRKNQLVGWCKSVSISDAAWCASMFVAPEYRRQGFGRALVAAMLRSDEAAGLTTSVLVASAAGAKLYAATGYDTVGVARVFTPDKTKLQYAAANPKTSVTSTP